MRRFYMKKITILFVLFALALCSCKKDVTKNVDLFIGTGANGHTYPGVVAPFGMVQPSPETGNSNWKYCSGYAYVDNKIVNFGQTHLSGTGCPDGGDIAFMPFVGDANKDDFSSAFKKENENAELGKYSVVLDDAKCKVNLTASDRVALYEIEYFEDGGAVRFDYHSILHGWGKLDNRVPNFDIKKVDDYTLVGTRKTLSFTRRETSFAIRFDKPIRSQLTLKAIPLRAPRVAYFFDLKKGDILKVKIAISSANTDGALKNLATMPDWNFEKTATQTRAAWNDILSKIQIDADADKKKIFYTALYHSLVSPNNIADVDGTYRGANGELAKSSNASGMSFTNFSLWDTYRATLPLTAILLPEKMPEYVNSMLDHFDATGVLPTNQFLGKETWCMIGNHAISVIAGAIQRDQKGFDVNRAMRAMISSSTENHNKSDFKMLEKFGYYPFDKCNPESVSKTLETCFDDYCLSEAAKKVGDTATAEKFAKRSQNYKNLFDKSTGFMRGKDSKGAWRTPFNPFDYSHAETFGGDYTEGNAWQYTFHVQHDTDEFIKMFGGNEKLVSALDKMFEAKEYRKDGDFKKSDDVTGLIGMYAHGNEPCHHVVYFYTLAGRQDKTAEIVRKICSELYTTAIDGLCGNDDCGQMSSWYVFSAMGFYPFNPNGLEYVLGAPQVNGAVISLANDKKFVMKAHNLSEKNKYVKSVKVNGKVYEQKTIPHTMFVEGGTLEFFMGEK